MNRPYTVVLFDVDGTLVDSADAVIRGIQHAMMRMGLKERSPEELMAFVGPPLWETFAHYGLSPEEAAEAVAHYREFYHDIFLDPPMFPGVRNMLEALHAAGIPMATATSKQAVMAREQITFLGLDEVFTVVAGATPDPSSTKETVIEEALARLAEGGADVSRPVLIGDRKWDVIGGRAVGIPVIGVEWGYAEEGELDGVVDMVATPEALVALLTGQNSSDSAGSQSDVKPAVGSRSVEHTDLAEQMPGQHHD